jgi:hypothetical protein
MSGLSIRDSDAIRLIVRSKDIGDGWRQVAMRQVYELYEKLPDELVEKDPANRRVRLTDAGKVVAQWLT